MICLLSYVFRNLKNGKTNISMNYTENFTFKKTMFSTDSFPSVLIFQFEIFLPNVNYYVNQCKLYTNLKFHIETNTTLRI